MPDPTTGVPTLIEAGNSYSFYLSYSDFPTADYDLDFVIRQGNSAPKVIAATKVDGKFLIQLATSATEDLAAGESDWASYAKATGVRKTAATGKMQVACNLSRAKPISFAESQVVHFQNVLKNMTGTLQSASPTLQTTQFQLEKVQGQITYWESVVAIENTRDLLARNS